MRTASKESNDRTNGLAARGSADESEVAVPRRKTMASNAAVQNGPAARSFADDAHDCIMVAIRTDRPNTRLWRDFCAPMASSPRIMSYRRLRDYSCRRKESRTIAIHSGSNSAE